MISVLIVDDHPIVLDGIGRLLEAQADITIVGKAINGEGCKEMLKKHSPDIVMLDINLPDISGMDLCRFISNRYPQVKVIALTGFNEYYYMQNMLANGASGYLLKNALPDEIIECIHKVHMGKEFLSSDVRKNMALHEKKHDKPLYLTPRETELMKYIIEGCTSKEIAVKMRIGIETVNGYRKALLIKFGVKNTAALVKLVMEHKLM